jgi:FkbM family methyltransferase
MTWLSRPTRPTSTSALQAIPEPVSGEFELVDSHIGRLWFRVDDDVIRPAVKQSGHWEPQEESLLRRIIQPGCRFLDVGANVGWFSVLAAKIAPSVSIDAVEPIPASLRSLRMNLWEHAPHAQIHPVALGVTRGVVAMEEAPHNPGDARVMAGVESAGVLVASITGDELFAERTFDVMKVDVQGAEIDVLTGLQATIERSAGLKCVVEFQPSAIVDRGERPQGTLDMYRSLGFSMLASVADRLQPMSDDEILNTCASAGAVGFVNLLLTR